MWIFNYVKRTDTDIPNLDGLTYLLGRINRAMQIMYPSDDSLQAENGGTSDDKLPEPSIE